MLNFCFVIVVISTGVYTQSPFIRNHITHYITTWRDRQHWLIWSSGDVDWRRQRERGAGCCSTDPRGEGAERGQWGGASRSGWTPAEQDFLPRTETQTCQTAHKRLLTDVGKKGAENLTCSQNLKDGRRNWQTWCVDWHKCNLSRQTFPLQRKSVGRPRQKHYNRV